MTADFIPPQPPKSHRIVLEVFTKNDRLDNLLLNALRSQTDDLDLQNISRTKFKDLFTQGKVQIKGQKARPSSAIHRGITYIDILR